MSTFYTLDFEKPVREVEQRLEALGRGPAAPAAMGVAEPDAAAPPTDLESQRRDLLAQRDRLLTDLYGKLSAWDTVRVARHPARPQGRDYISRLCRDFAELHGDRRFGDDPAIVCGLGRIGSIKCMLIAHHKGRSTQEKLECHFGCAHPEGYRKALLKMKLAEKMKLPVVTLVDTPGAYPGIGAEQRGQAEAIAVNLREMARLRTPVVSVIIGEGGSGGALGLAVADRVGMMAHAWYSVISPEGCAAILWKQANETTNAAAARALKLTAADNLELGIIDAIIPEPVGGAHRDPEAAAANLEAWIVSQLEQLEGQPAEELLEARYQRFRRLGAFEERQPAPPPPEEEAVETPAGAPAEGTAPGPAPDIAPGSGQAR